MERLSEGCPAHDEAGGRHQEVERSRRRRRAAPQQQEPEQERADRDHADEPRHEQEERGIEMDRTCVLGQQPGGEECGTCCRLLRADDGEQRRRGRHEPLERERAGDDAGESAEQGEDADGIGAPGKMVPNDERCAREAEHDAGELAPGQRLAEQRSREHSDQHRVEAGDDGGKPGGDGRHPDPGQALVAGLVKQPEQREPSPGHAPQSPRERGGSEQEGRSEQEAAAQEQFRRAGRDCELRGRERGAPSQYEQEDEEGIGAAEAHAARLTCAGFRHLGRLPANLRRSGGESRQDRPFKSTQAGSITPRDRPVCGAAAPRRRVQAPDRNARTGCST